MSFWLYMIAAVLVLAGLAAGGWWVYKYVMAW